MAGEVKQTVPRGRRRLPRLSSKNQVTLPVAVLARAHLAPGDDLDIAVDDRGRIVIVAAADPWDEFVGTMPGLERDVDLTTLRREWDR